MFNNCSLVAYDHSIISLPIIFDEQNKKYVIKNNDKKKVKYKSSLILLYHFTNTCFRTPPPPPPKKREGKSSCSLENYIDSCLLVNQQSNYIYLQIKKYRPSVSCTSIYIFKIFR